MEYFFCFFVTSDFVTNQQITQQQQPIHWTNGQFQLFSYQADHVYYSVIPNPSQASLGFWRKWWFSNNTEAVTRGCILRTASTVSCNEFIHNASYRLLVWCYNLFCLMQLWFAFNLRNMIWLDLLSSIDLISTAIIPGFYLCQVEGLYCPFKQLKY